MNMHISMFYITISLENQWFLIRFMIYVSMYPNMFSLKKRHRHLKKSTLVKHSNCKAEIIIISPCPISQVSKLFFSNAVVSK